MVKRKYKPNRNFDSYKELLDFLPVVKSHHQPELEQAVLGAIMVSPEALHSVIETIGPLSEVFYIRSHQYIYEAARSLYNDGKPVDIMTVYDMIIAMGHGDTIQAYHITELTGRVASGAHAEQHSKILMQYYLRRSLIENSLDIMAVADDESHDIFELLEDAQKKIANVSEFGFAGKVMNSDDIINNFLRQQAKAQQVTSEITGVKTGITLLDEITAGWQDTDLIILGARPGMGKTSFTKAVVQAAAKQDKPVAFFSLEMNSYQLTSRLFSERYKVDFETIRRGALNDSYVAQAEDMRKHFKNMLYVDDSIPMTLNHIKSRARRLVKEEGCKIIIVDYLQLITPESNNNWTMTDSMGVISRGLKTLAKELKVPILVLSQLNRDVEKREKKKPQLADLRQSGNIEQDADLVILLWRPEYYQFDTVKLDLYGKGEDFSSAGLCKVMVVKHRNGRLLDFWVKFHGKYTSFSDYLYDRHKGIPLDDEDKQQDINFNKVPSAPTELDEEDDLPF